MLELYKNIKSYRERLGLSQTELAEKIGYTSKTTISKIEAGKIDLPQSKIEAFAKVLGTTPGALMGWEKPEQSNDELLRLLDDPINRRIFEKLEAMSPEARKVALAQLDALAKYQDK